MKIQNVDSRENGIKARNNIDFHHSSESRALVFKKTLVDVSSDQQITKLIALKKDIDDQGMRLTKRADIKEFEKYRALIREFMEEVVSGGYQFSKDNAFESRGRYRLFATVKTVDEKLDKLAKEVLKEQSDNIEIASQIDEIRGLILDMML